MKRMPMGQSRKRPSKARYRKSVAKAYGDDNEIPVKRPCRKAYRRFLRTGKLWND